MKKPNGYILWEGISEIDGKTPIVVIATGFKTSTSNPKTGDMIQTWIICRDTHPTEAINGGGDKGICGECPHRKIDGKRTCYVNQMSIGSVYNAYKRGSYSTDVLDSHVRIAHLFRGKRVRLGAYGDPLAVPAVFWWTVTRHVVGHTGYTHQWRRWQAGGAYESIDGDTCVSTWSRLKYQNLCMASVDSEEEREEAEALGWRTFRVLTPEESPSDKEVRCPNEVDKSIKCDSCNLCQGTTVGQHVRSIAITVHGTGAKYFRFGDSPKAQCQEISGE
jgi:hypothetical protein